MWVLILFIRHNNHVFTNQRHEIFHNSAMIKSGFYLVSHIFLIIQFFDYIFHSPSKIMMLLHFKHERSLVHIHKNKHITASYTKLHSLYHKYINICYFIFFIHFPQLNICTRSSYDKATVKTMWDHEENCTN